MIDIKEHTVALIDGDIIAVRAAAVNQDGDPDDIMGSIHYLIREWTELAHADTCLVFVSEGKCFRYQAYDEYKANRKDTPKPKGTDFAKSYLLDTYDQILSDPLLEADDRMGLYATESQDEEVRIIVSSDKDMRQIPAWQMSPDHHRFPWLQNPDDALRWWAEQILCGDRVDGYPGLKILPEVKRFGPKAFQKWWEEESDDTVVFRMLEAFGDPDLYQSQHDCATILHHSDNVDLGYFTQTYGLAAI